MPGTVFINYLVRVLIVVLLCKYTVPGNGWPDGRLPGTGYLYQAPDTGYQVPVQFTEFN